MRTSVIALASAVLLVPTLAGCGLGQAVPTTIEIGGVGNGVDVVSSDRQVQDVTIVTDGDSVGISATVINGSDAPITLTGVEVRGQALTLNDSATSVTTGLEIVRRGALRIGYNSAISATGPSELEAGEYAQVRFTFADGSLLSAKALIVSKAGMYASVLTDPAVVA